LILKADDHPPLPLYLLTPKKKSERDVAKTNKNKACPAGMYRNPNGQCQPNETGN